jgi:D-arginine dehydrogenase
LSIQTNNPAIYDFLIIGGGIAGISAGARLADLGSVLLLEAENALGYHATGRSAAMYAPNYGNAIIRTLNAASKYFLDQDPNVLRQRDVLAVAGIDDEKSFQALLVDGYRQISLGEAIERMPLLRPDTVKNIAIDPKCFDIDVDLLVQNYARTLRKQGGRIEFGARAHKITRSQDTWCVETGKGAYQAPVLINAAGGWADGVGELAGLGALGLCPMRRSVACIPVPNQPDIANWPFLLGASETWYAKPDAGNFLISPGDEEPIEAMDAWADDLVLAEGLHRFEQFVDFEVTRIQSSWAGLRTFASDRTPVVGFDPRAEGFFWLAGQGGYGVQTSPAISQLVADLIAESTDLENDITADLSPARLLEV